MSDKYKWYIHEGTRRARLVSWPGCAEDGRREGRGGPWPGGRRPHFHRSCYSSLHRQPMAPLHHRPSVRLPTLGPKSSHSQVRAAKAHTAKFSSTLDHTCATFWPSVVKRNPPPTPSGYNCEICRRRSRRQQEEAAWPGGRPGRPPGSHVTSLAWPGGSYKEYYQAPPSCLLPALQPPPLPPWNLPLAPPDSTVNIYPGPKLLSLGRPA